MKYSIVVKIVLVFVVLTTTYYLFSNYTKSDFEILSEKYVSGIPNWGNELSSYSDRFRKENYEAILLKGGISTLFLLILIYALRRNERKSEPKHNLKLMKKKGVITDEEYVVKLSALNDHDKLKREKLKQESEIDNVVSSMNNLLKSGVISKEEYEDKLRRFNEE